MSKPYRLPEADFVPGPYAPIDADALEAEARAREQQQRDDNSQQSQSSTAGVALIPSSETAAVSQSTSVTFASNATSSATSTASTSAATSSAAAAQTSAFTAAQAMVNAMAASALAANAALAPVVAVVTSIAATAPFAVLAVLGAYGLNNPAEVSAAASKLTAEFADALSDAIASVMASFNENAVLSNASFYLDRIIAEAESNLVHAETVAATVAKHHAAASLQSETVAQATGHPTYTAPEIVSISSLTADENHEHVVTATIRTTDGIVEQKYVIAAQDYEATKSVPLKIALTDRQGGHVERDVTVEVKNVNEAPVITGIDVATIRENRMVEATVTALDPEQGVLTRTCTIAPQDYEINPQIILAGSITDAGGLSDTRGFSISIEDVNEAPVLLLPETEFDGQTLRIHVAGADQDANDSVVVTGGGDFTYAITDLIAGVAPFSIVATDRAGLTSEPMLIEPPRILAQAVADGSVPPSPPTIVAVSASSIPENQATRVKVTAYDATDGLLIKEYDISAQDYDTLSVPPTIVMDSSDPYAIRIAAMPGIDGHPVSLALTSSSNPINVARIDDATVVVRNQFSNVTFTASDSVSGAKSTLSYGADRDHNSGDSGPYNIVRTSQPAATVTIHAEITNSAGLTATKDFAIAITNVNETPVLAPLGEFSIREDAALAPIFDVRAVDPDAGDSVTYSIVSQTVPNQFKIATNAAENRGIVILNKPLDFELGVREHDVVIRATDRQGLSSEQTVHINVENVLETRVIYLRDFDVNGGIGSIFGDATSSDRIHRSENYDVMRFYFTDLGYQPSVSLSGSGSIVSRGRNYVDVGYSGASGEVQHYDTNIYLHEV